MLHAHTFIHAHFSEKTNWPLSASVLCVILQCFYIWIKIYFPIQYMRIIIFIISFHLNVWLQNIKANFLPFLWFWADHPLNLAVIYRKSLYLLRLPACIQFAGLSYLHLFLSFPFSSKLSPPTASFHPSLTYSFPPSSQAQPHISYFGTTVIARGWMSFSLPDTHTQLLPFEHKHVNSLTGTSCCSILSLLYVSVCLLMSLFLFIPLPDHTDPSPSHSV